jgi:hypothetical protein
MNGHTHAVSAQQLALSGRIVWSNVMAKLDQRLYTKSNSSFSHDA